VAQYFNSGTFIVGQSIATNVVIAAAPIVEFINTPTDQPVYTEVGFTAYPTSNSFATLALGIAPAQGVGPYNISPNSGAYDGVSGPSAVQVATAWRIAPTVPTNFIRRMTINAQAVSPNTPLVVKWPRGGLKLKPSTSLVLYLIPGAAGRYWWGEYWMEFDE
jgi:hypothetical protein